MILSDSTINELVKGGKLISRNFSPQSLTPNGYDLRVGTIKGSSGNITDHAEIEPAEHFLVSSQEEIYCPTDVCAQMFTRSSYARKGIIGSYGFVDAGFRGELTLAFYNSSNEVFSLKAGERIAQIIFHRIDREVEQSYEKRSGNYQNSSGITLSRDTSKGN